MQQGVTRSRPRLAYELHGAHGPRVVLVMGLGMRGAAWRPQIEGLRRDHRLLAYDHQGIGESAGRRPPVRTMAGMSRDLLRLLDDVGWRDAHVVGVSMGGMISIETALRAPERVRSLTLIATHAGGTRARIPAVHGVRDFSLSFLHPHAPSRLQALRTLLYPPEYLSQVEPRTIDERLAAQFGPAPVSRSVVLGQLTAVGTFDARCRLRQLETPTLIIKPERDVLVRPRNSDYLASRIRTAHLVSVPGAGHGVIFQEAALVNERIRRHVSDVEATQLALSVSSIHA